VRWGGREWRTAAPRPAPSYLTRLAIRDIGRVVFLDVSEIDWIEAADYYVQIHAGSQTCLHREEHRKNSSSFSRGASPLLRPNSRLQSGSPSPRTPGRTPSATAQAHLRTSSDPCAPSSSSCVPLHPRALPYLHSGGPCAAAMGAPCVGSPT
jgi:hypothetical protein